MDALSASSRGCAMSLVAAAEVVTKDSRRSAAIVPFPVQDGAIQRPRNGHLAVRLTHLPMLQLPRAVLGTRIGYVARSVTHCRGATESTPKVRSRRHGGSEAPAEGRVLWFPVVAVAREETHGFGSCV